MSDQGKKIIVDEDWKQEAQHEKELLEQKLEEEKHAQHAVPTASFEVLINSLAMPAMLNLGMINMPKHSPNLEEAKFYIDLLEVVEQKTKGNLDVNEHNMLKTLLYELRMAFVTVTSKSNPPLSPS